MWTKRPSPDLDARLKPFLDRSLLSSVPNAWQRFQGQVEMTPFVLSPDVTAERFYRDHWLAHPVIRQPFLFSLVGRDHLNTGSGLSNRLSSICRHLQMTWHEGMPVFDLQIVQTHPRGLDTLRSSIESLTDPQTADDRKIRRQVDRLFPDPDVYFRHFTRSGGWIDQAASFRYPQPSDLGSTMPEAFFSLVGFLEHCRAHSAHPSDVGWTRVPAHLTHLASRWWRSGEARQPFNEPIPVGSS
jgi:hypothetical protein